ncbi:MAG: hypothetical protein WC372_02520 [Candidatus Neomarinimicrobiota bacterium]|jgi:hypothetical protein|nr:hypothetical protein [Candidatus Neomarinimicrobiota bacterium]MDX9780240.1 hypothetical protein [bacterium]
MRGLAIAGVLISHNLILDVWYGRQAFQIVPPWIIGLLFPLLIIFTWAGSFVLISGISTAYTAFRRFDNGVPAKKIISPILINGIALLLLDPLRTLVFSRPHLFRGEMTHSIFSKLIMTGEWGLPSPERLYLIGALPMIGLSGCVAALLVWLLFRKDRESRFERNLGILFVAGFVFSLVSIPLSYTMEPLIDRMLSVDNPHYIAAYLLRILGSAQLSFFPMGCYVFFGVAYGMLLASGKAPAYVDGMLKRFGNLFFIATAVSIPVTFLFTKNPIRFLGNIDIYSPTIIYFSLGCITYIFKALVKHVEFGEIEKRRRFAERTRWLRRFGILTLTLYIVDAVPGMFAGEWFHHLFGGKALWAPLTEGRDAFMTNPFAIIVFVALMFAFWFLMISLWEKSNFAGSFEWLMVKISGLFRKESSRRLDLRNNLYEDETEGGGT